MGSKKHHPYQKQFSKIKTLHLLAGFTLLALGLIDLGAAIWIPAGRVVREFTLETKGVVAHLFNLGLLWVVAAAILFGALIHLCLALTKSYCKHYVEAVLEYDCNMGDFRVHTFKHPMARHVDHWRWVCFALVATLLMWCVARLAGISSILLSIAIAVMTIAIQFCGYAMEVLNANVQGPKEVATVPFWTGLVLWVFTWTAIFVQLVRSAQVEDLGWYVYAVVIGTAVVSVLFALVMLGRYMRSVKFLRINYNVVLSFIILELLMVAVITVPLIVAAFMAI
jgi:hypothetical protein